MKKPYINFCTIHEREWNGVLPVECCPWCEVERLRKLCAEAAEAVSHGPDDKQWIVPKLIDAAWLGEGTK